MSALKRIRENVGLVIVIIAVSLFAFIFSSLVQNIGPSNKNIIAEVNGSDIPYEQYNAKYDQFQRNNPRATSTEEQYQLREQAWQTLLREIIFKREFDASGLGISPDEQMMIFQGQIYEPSVIQSGYFSDSLGRYNPNRVAAVFQNADNIDLNDPNVPDEYKMYKIGLMELRASISNTRLMNKWQKIIMNSGMVSDNEVKVAYENQSGSADISYVYVPYSSISEEQLKITDADRNEYFSKHRESYRREDEVRIKYGYFKVSPNNQDSVETREGLSKLKREFLSSTEAFAFAFSNTDDESLDTTAQPLANLPSELAGVNGRTDTVVGPILSETGYQLLRIVKVEQDSVNANVDLRHILIRPLGATAADSATAKASAEEIRTQVAADKNSFEGLAQSKSADQGTGATGGNLGWVSEAIFGETAAKDIKNAKVGDVIVTESENGFHVIEVKDRSNKLYAFAKITREITAGSATNDSVFQRASKYLGDVLSGTDMDKAATAFPDMRMSESGNIGAGTYNLLGLTGARPVITWAFNSNIGTVSDHVIEAEGAYVIARVEYKGDKGYSTIEDLAKNAEFQAAVANYVRAKQIKGKMGAGGGDLASIASAYGPGAISGSASGLSFAKNDIKDLGNEPKVVGRAFGLAKGTVSKPISGNVGVFVIRVENRTEPAPMEEFAKMFQKQMLEKSKSEAVVNALFQGMIDIADIRDYRYRVDQ